MSAIVAIRFDVSAAIGTGHLRRSIAFGTELKERAIQHYYVTSENSINTAISLGVPSHQIIGFQPQLGEQDWVKNLPGLTHVITDICHHERDQGSASLVVKSILSEKSVVLAVIDSMPPYDFQSKHDTYPSFVITPYFGAERLRYSPNCDYWLAGIQYAILDQEYKSLHQSFEQRTLSSGQSILICCGGSDPDRHTEFILQLLTDTQSPQVDIKLVIGNLFAASRITKIKKIATRFPEKISLYTNRNSIADLIVDCGVLLGLVGLIRYEAACLGKPSYFLQNNSDYENYFRNFDRAGLGKIFCFQDENERTSFETFVRNLNSVDFFSKVNRPNRVAFELVDGYGVQRILDKFLTVGERKHTPIG